MTNTLTPGKFSVSLGGHGLDDLLAGLERIELYPPLGFDAGDGNLYRYVGNDPTDWIDPTGLQQTSSPSLPKAEDVKKISAGVINKLQNQKQNGGLPTGTVPLPGAPTLPETGKPDQYRGPCALYAQGMTNALNGAGIKSYKLHFYNVTNNNKVYYTPPQDPKSDRRPQIQSVEVTARKHVIVEVQTDTGTLFFDAGAGVDRPEQSPATEGLTSSGNFGDPTTGVIDQKNRDIGKFQGKPLLQEITPKATLP